MKLITEKGELALPDDFSFEIEANNPLFSDEGTSSVPAELPATGRTLDILDHPERPGRTKRLIRKVPAILQHGVFQRRCNMLVESAGTEAGISASLAFSESEMYSGIKGRTLKEIFQNCTLDPSGLSGSIEEKIKSICTDIFLSPFPDEDVAVFPVAIEKSEDSYSQLNEYDPDNKTFVCGAREIASGDDKYNVPAGYGVTVFLRLCKMVEMTFTLNGYRIGRNDLNVEPFKSIVVLNNCSDTFCKDGTVRGQDLVPSMTVEDFIAWLKDKFCASVFLKSGEISIVLMQKALTDSPDIDLSPLVRDDITLSYPASSRVALSCDTSLDGAAPAAETAVQFQEKYDTISLLKPGSSPAVQGIYYRPEMGRFSKIWNIRTSVQGKSFKEDILGSDCFSYDRKNSDDSEEHSTDDRFVPAMKHKDGYMLPYIGERLHYNTFVPGEEEEADQPLQICYAFWDSSSGKWFGSSYPYAADGTQMKYGQQTSPGTPAVSLPYPPLTPEGLYSPCWKSYNGLLLNGAPEIEAQIDYPIYMLLSIALNRPKLLYGQKVMVKSFSYEISETGIKCSKSMLQLLPSYSDKVQDKPIDIADDIASSDMVWTLVNTKTSSINALIQELKQGDADSGSSIKITYSYSTISDDGVQNYSENDAPDYTPDKKDIIEKERSRWVRIQVKKVKRGSHGILDEETSEHTVNYKEYFKSASTVS